MSSNRVQLNVAVAMQSVVFILGQAGFEAPFPQGTTALVGAIDMLDKALTQMLHHEGWARGFLGRKQQVNMVCHQAVSVNGAAIFYGLFLQLIQVEKVILFREEACRAVVASLNDVPGHICDGQSRPSWHLEFLFDVALKPGEYRLVRTG